MKISDSFGKVQALSSPRERLPEDVFFVLMNGPRWQTLIDGQHTNVRFSVDDFREKIVTNEDCWLVAPFLALRERFENVYLTDHVQPGKICVFSGVDLGARQLVYRCFSIATRSDGAAPELADLRIVQNQLSLNSEKDRYLPHWPQPGLIPRNAARGDNIERLTFKGSNVNLYAPLRTREFSEELNKLGVVFSTDERDEVGLTANWHDYSDADLVLALREIAVDDLQNKPASKLVNAWLAGVPALLGPEPAFLELKQSELDFISVCSISDVVAAVRTLKQDPSRYRAMIENCARRALEYTPERATDRWAKLLSEEVPKLYGQWKRRNDGVLKAAAVPRYAFRYFKHRRAQSLARTGTNTGIMLLSGEPRKD